MRQPQDMNASVSSLAMLSLRMLAGKDYLDFLQGFVAESLRRMDGEAVDAARLKEPAQSEFGLNIPGAMFSIYLKRLSYGFASNLRDALPNASFIGFTGASIEKADANTRAVFDDNIPSTTCSAPLPSGARPRTWGRFRPREIDGV